MTSSAHDRGVALIALLVSLTVALIAMTAVLPAWKYVVQNEREKELLFRGAQIVNAIAEFQRKNGNALPPSIEALVKGKYLRKDFKDPMDPKKGEWRLIRQGEPVTPICPVGGLSPSRPLPQPARSAPALQGGGPIVGVASRSKETSLRKLNNCPSYDKWLFIIGQPRDWDFSGGEPVRVPQRVGPQGAQMPSKGPAPGAQPMMRPLVPRPND